jgi:hypothetical protein
MPLLSLPSFLFLLSFFPVKDPMDLGTMEERLASRRYYITLNMLAADFYKMVKNCQVGGGCWGWVGAGALRWQRGAKLAGGARLLAVLLFCCGRGEADAESWCSSFCAP